MKIKRKITNQDFLDALTDVDDSPFVELMGVLTQNYIEFIDADIPENEMPNVLNDAIAYKQHFDTTKSDRPFIYFTAVVDMVVRKYHTGSRKLRTH